LKVKYNKLLQMKNSFIASTIVAFFMMYVATVTFVPNRPRE